MICVCVCDFFFWCRLNLDIGTSHSPTKCRSVSFSFESTLVDFFFLKKKKRFCDDENVCRLFDENVCDDDICACVCVDCLMIVCVCDDECVCGFFLMIVCVCACL